MQCRYHQDRNTCSQILNNIIDRFKPCIEITKELIEVEDYSGIIVIDGKFVPCKEKIKEAGREDKYHSRYCLRYPKTEDDVIPRSKKRRKIKKGFTWMIYTDYPSHDIPELVVGRSENTEDYGTGFKHLKEIGYPLKAITCDKREAIVIALRRYFLQVLVQYCIKHYLAEIQKNLKILNYRRSVKSIINKIEKINYDGCAYLRDNSRKKTIRLVNQLLKLEFQYEIINDFYETLIELLWAESIKQRDSKRRYLENTFFAKYFPLETLKNYQKRIMKVYYRFLEDEKYLFTSLEHPELDIPRTTNINEGYNNQIENRIFSIRGFETIKTCKDYGNALILKRRFRKFTDCKGKFKHLNGKSPLEIAGADTGKIKNWIRFSIKKKG